MSDMDSADNTPAPIDHRPSKRRHIYDDSEASTPRESSPDEHERRTYRSSNLREREDPEMYRRSQSPNDSDEDDHDHEYRRRGRSRSHSSSRHSRRSSHSSPAAETSNTKYKPVRVNYESQVRCDGHTRGVAQVRFSPDGRWLASGSADGTLKIWDADTGQHLRTMEGHLAGISTVAWSPDSNTIATGSDDKTIRLWHRETGKPYPGSLVGHHNYVFSIAFSPKGNMLVSGSYDEAVFLWDLRARRVMRSLPAHSDPVGGVDFIKDGTLVCSCSTDGLVRVWDTATGQCLRTLVHEDNASVTTVRFSPNGRYILAWTLDSCIRLWDYVSGTCKKTYQGHVNKTISLGGAFGVSNSEAFIVSGSEDGDILFWDVKTKEVIQRISGAHEGAVCWVDTLSGPVNKVASAGIDGSVRIWYDVPGESDPRQSNGSKVNGHKHEDDMMDIEDVNQDDYDTLRDDMLEIDGHFDQRMEEMTI